MTKSELIARLAERYPQLVAKDADFAVKTLPTLEGRWNRHKAIIDSLRDRHPDLFDQVADAFELRKNEITDDSTQGLAAQ